MANIAQIIAKDSFNDRVRIVPLLEALIVTHFSRPLADVRFVASEIAQIAAAIGREFGYGLIAAVAPVPQAQLDASLAQLCKVGTGLPSRHTS